MYDKAIQSYTKAIRLDKSDYACFFKRGQAYGKINNHERAIGDYSTVLNINPDYSMAYFNRSIQFSDIGYIASAIEDISAYIRKNPQEYEGYNKRVAYFRETGDYENALCDLKKMIRISPSPDVFNMCGYLHAANKKYEKAISDFKIACRISPNDVKASEGIGETLYLQNRKEEAVTWLEKAVSLNSTNVNTYFFIGLFGQENKNFTKAISNYEKGINLKTAVSSALFCNLGICYCCINEFEEAQKYLEKSLVINPNEIVAKEALINIQCIQDEQAKQKNSKTVGEIKTNIRKGRNYPCIIHKNQGIDCLYGHPFLKGPKGCNSAGVPCYWDNYIESTYIKESNIKLYENGG